MEITLEPDPDGTRVRLRHTGLPATEPPRAHLAGWPEPDPLADHIGRAQRMGGGARLVGRGDPDPCHGVVRFGWSADEPGEVVLATGTNVAGTDLDGRFRWVTGFWTRPRSLPKHHSVPDRPHPARGVFSSTLARRNPTNPSDPGRILHTR